MPIYQRDNIWYIDIQTASGKRIRRSTGTTDKIQAQEYHDQIKHQLWRQERVGERPTYTWDEAALRWITEMADKKSIDSDKGKIRRLTAFRGLFLDDMDRDFIMRTINARNCSKSTKNRYLALVSAILNKAEKEWEWIEKAPFLKKHKEPKKRIRWLTPDEANRLIAALPPHLAKAAAFSLLTGLRQGNVLGLTWQQIDLQRGVAWIWGDQTKSGRDLGVALNQGAIRILQSQLGAHHEFVFTNKRGGQIKSISNRDWKIALEKANITNFRWHDLRHTWASWLVQRGVPLAILQEMGGWESIEMVQRYAHLSPTHLHQHALLLDGNDTKMAHPKIDAPPEKYLDDCLLDNILSKNKNLSNCEFGGPSGFRTHDQGIMSPLL